MCLCLICMREHMRYRLSLALCGCGERGSGCHECAEHNMCALQFARVACGVDMTVGAVVCCQWI